MYVSGCLPAGSLLLGRLNIYLFGLLQSNEFTHSKAVNSGKFEHLAHPGHTHCSDASCNDQAYTLGMITA